MPVFEIGLDDGRKLRVEADDQEAALSGVAYFQNQEGAKAPSGVMAGLINGSKELIAGNAETAKDFYGVGKGRQAADPDYVPANITGGSLNPLKWNYSQVPQKIAEQAPGLVQDIGAATMASKVAPGGIPGKALAGLVGGGLSAWHRTAGDTAKEAAAARTGNPDAATETQDLVKGGATAAAASAISALTPARFIPGANKITSVGAQGALDAAKKYGTTVATGTGASAASDAITQAGVNIGTDKEFDPARTLEAGVGGGLTAGAIAAPRGAADVFRASSLRAYGGANLDATKNYATRLQTAGDEGLGGAKTDFKAHETVKTDLKNELRDTAKNVRNSTALHPDVDNALQRAQEGKTITSKDIDLIEKGTASAPDGANAAFLSRTMRMAQLAESRGSYDGHEGAWSGGISGVMDKNLGFMMNPVRLAGGTIATAMGMQLLGLSNPLFAGSVAGGYGAARAIDRIAGTRSPAKTFAENFADHNAQLRVAQTPQAPAPAPPQGGPTQGPWGPRPSAPTVPNVAPPGPPAATVPSINPMALAMLKQKLKQGLPPTPAPDAPTAPQMPTINPVALKMTQAAMKRGLPEEPAPAAPAAPDAPPMPSFNPMALKMMQQKLKQGLPPEQTSESTAAPVPVVDNTAVPPDVLRATKALMSGRAKVDAMKTQNITKKHGGHHAAGDPYANTGGYEPIPVERMNKFGMDHDQMAQLETDSYMAGRPKLARDKYRESIMDTLAGRRDVIDDVKSKHPEYSVALDGLLKQLYELGSSRKRAVQAINHYAGLMSPQAGKTLKDTFKPQLDRLWQK